MDELQDRYHRLPAAPTDRAAVELVVMRLPGEARSTPPRVRLDPAEGVVGDRWGTSKRDPEAQVTLMRADVARMLIGAGGIEAFGDNLFATLDTSAENLPAGTIVRVGTARCQVTPKPHTGCSKFTRRGVPGAREFTQTLAALQLRGVHLRVLDAGEVGVGDAIVVER